MRRSRLNGFTLTELLIAAAIMGIILATLGSLFVSSTKAYRANDEASALQQNSGAAERLLAYEISLAGYRGSDTNAQSRTFDSTPIVGTVSPAAETTLAITTGSSATTPDTVAVRYYEDRFESGPTPSSVQFSVDTKNNSLYRRKSTDTKREPLVQGVYNLKVLRYIREDGRACNTVPTSTPPAASTLVGLKLELTFTDQIKKQLVVTFPNKQVAPVLPTLTVLASPSGC